MKRSLLIPLAILAALLAFSAWNGRYMSAQVCRWQSQLQTAAEQAQNENWAGAMDTLKTGYADWSSYQTYLHIVTQHSATDDAEAMYHRAMAFAVTEEITEFRAEISDLVDQLRLLSEMEELRIGNVLTSLPAACSALP